MTCGREVYEIAPGPPRKARVERAYNCMVGCSTCAVVCPTSAITFPPRDLVWKAEREHKIFAEVRKEAAEKRGKQQVAQARERAEGELRKVQTRTRIGIAGGFGDKEFLMKSEAKVKDQPYDIVNLKLEVPTVKGLLEKTPAYMTFEITSTEQKAVSGFLAIISGWGLLRDSARILLESTPPGLDLAALQRDVPSISRCAVCITSMSGK